MVSWTTHERDGLLLMEGRYPSIRWLQQVRGAVAGHLQRYSHQAPPGLGPFLCTNKALTDMSYQIELLTYARYACATASVKRLFAEGENMWLIRNSFKAVIAHSEAAPGKDVVVRDVGDYEPTRTTTSSLPRLYPPHGKQ